MAMRTVARRRSATAYPQYSGVALLSVGLTVGGCNAILGNEEGHLVSDQGGTSGSSAAAGQSGDDAAAEQAMGGSRSDEDVGGGGNAGREANGGGSGGLAGTTGSSGTQPGAAGTAGSGGTTLAAGSGGIAGSGGTTLAGGSGGTAGSGDTTLPEGSGGIAGSGGTTLAGGSGGTAGSGGRRPETSDETGGAPHSGGGGSGGATAATGGSSSDAETGGVGVSGAAGTSGMGGLSGAAGVAGSAGEGGIEPTTGGTTSSTGGTTSSTGGTSSSTGGTSSSTGGTTSSTGGTSSSTGGTSSSTGGTSSSTGGTTSSTGGTTSSTGGVGSCLCDTVDTCCDGCDPINEGNACADDGLACTEDRCTEGACTHLLTAGSCLIAGACAADETVNPDNACQWCDASQRTDGWSNRAQGTGCDDGRFCTGTESCSDAGACESTGDPCGGSVCDDARDACCTPNARVACSASGNVVNVDSCGNEGSVIQTCAPAASNGACCDADHGGCAEPTCACQPGYTGSGCNQCLRYVDVLHGNADNEGLSWEDAFISLDDALYANLLSSTPCEIWVAQGEYMPETPASGFWLNDVSLYGGFAGNEMVRSQRERNPSGTVLQGTISAYSSALHVLRVDYSARVIVDGFTIEGGNAFNDDEQLTDDDRGGGFLNSGNLLVKNCTIQDNYSYDDGCGIHNTSGSQVTVIDTRFLDNHAQQASGDREAWGGGGIASFSGQTTVINSYFTGNTSYATGCGIINYGTASLRLVHSTFVDNLCGGDDQVAMEDSSTLDMRNSIAWWLALEDGTTGSIVTTFSDVGRSGAGEGDLYGNIDLDPLLVGGALQIDSPCIDRAADPATTYADLDGNGRVGVPDMGALEYNGSPTTLDPLCGASERWSQNGHRYFTCAPVELTWHSAELYCRAIGGHLASVTSQVENDYVVSRLPANARAWIGLSDYQAESTWVWIFNESGNAYVNWASPAPDASMDCATISQADGQWSGSDCNVTTEPFVCELE